MLKSFLAVLKTDLILATRNADMLLFGIGMPIGVMLLLGSISSPEATRLDFGGVVAFGLCASGLMGLPLTLSGCRHQKVYKRLRATPASPGLLLASQAIVQCLYVAISSASIILIAVGIFGVRIEGGFGRFAASFLLAQAALFGLGLLVGSLAPSERAANAITSLLYFPSILVSGATIPFEILPRPVQAAAQVLPVTQGIGLLKGAVLGSPLAESALPALVLAAVALASYTLAARFFRWD